MNISGLSVWVAIGLAAVFAERAPAYNMHHGPFDSETGVKRIPLVEMENTNGVITAGKQRIHHFVIPGDSGMQVRAYGSEEGFQVEMSASGKVMVPKTRFSGFSFEPGLAAYTADLNGDGKRDFAVYSYSGGCGLASGYCDIAFLLSNRDGYALVTVSTLWPDPGDWVVLGGKPCFMATDFEGEEKCKDGKEHNFWIYHILVIEGAAMRIDNSLAPGFPRSIWYSFRPNHDETTLLTDKQKAKLLQRARKEMFQSVTQDSES